jgi:hypothetical protein
MSRLVRRPFLRTLDTPRPSCPVRRAADLRARLLLLPLEQRVTPATFMVSNTADAGTGSLRQAILYANDAAGAAIITFNATA